VSLVTVEDYHWKYTNTSEFALKGIDLSIDEGTFVGVIGPNGSGKTTLAYSLNGLIPSQYYGVRKGSITIDGREVKEYRADELARYVGVVFSDPEAQFTAMTVEDEVVFGMENIELGVEEIRERLEWVVPLTEIGHLMDKPPYEVSGGQKQRVALAAVLAMTPRVIVMDEPTSMLDPISRKRVFDVLGRLKREQNNTIVAIEHNLENLIPLADRMVLLYEGEILLNDAPQPFFEQMALLLKHNVFPPGAIRYFFDLRRAGHNINVLPLTLDEAEARLRNLLEHAREARNP
jgi:energy-coupling factor transport system ATP-binding protein